MAFSAGLGQRPPIEWSARILLAATAGIVGYGAVMHALAQSLPAKRIEQMPGIASMDARTLGELAAVQIVQQAGVTQANARRSSQVRVQIAKATAFAHEALGRDPTVVPAVVALGLAAELRGEADSARQWFAYSERLSRRNLTAQLWLIEDAVRRNDIAGALRHYDTALRTKSATASLLFPLLAAASNDPAIEPELRKTLSSRPIWASDFIGFLSANTPDPVATASLFIALRRSGVNVHGAASAAIIGKLLDAAHFDAAWTYYTTLRPGTQRVRSRDPEFAAILDRPTELDWVPLPHDTGLSASIQRDGERSLFDFSAPPSVGGPMLQQVQLLPAGRYQLDGKSAGIEQPERSQPYWVLTCRSDGRELGRVALPNSSTHGGRFTGSVTVPPDCLAQTLTLIARTSDEINGLAGQIEHAELRRIE